MPGRDDVGAMRAFVERHGLGGVPAAADPDGGLWSRLGVRGQPTWIFVDDGGEVSKEFGDFEAEALRSRFERLLAR